MMACDKRNQIEAFFLGEIPDNQQDMLARHVEKCPECRSLIESYRRIRGIIAQRPRPDLPAHLEKKIRRRIDEISPVKRPAGSNAVWRGLFPVFPRPAFQWGALVTTFCLGLFLGKMLFAPPDWSAIYSKIQKEDPGKAAHMEARYLKNYLLGVETLLLDISNMDPTTAYSKDDWEIEASISSEMLRRTRELKRSVEKKDPALYYLLMEIEWILEEMTLTQDTDLADLASEIQDQQILSKIHGFLS